jgi:hypothetical protein
LTNKERKLQAWPYEKGSVVKLFILAGHRNMEGERAFTQELAALGNNERLLANDNHLIAFKYSIGGGYHTSQGWEPLGPAGFYDTFGPELSFGQPLHSQQAGNIAVAKFTHSGSQINDWTPEGTTAIDRNLYPQFVAFIRESIQELEAKGHAVELAGIFYHVGENDMAFGRYRRNVAQWLQAIVNQSRGDLGQSQLMWTVSQQSPTVSQGLNPFDVTDQLSQIAAADPRFIHVKAFNLPPQQEQLVITAAGIVELGKLLAAAHLDRSAVLD